MEALGRLCNLVAVASGVHIPLSRGTSVMFVVYEDGGDTQATTTQGINGASAVDLATVSVVYTGNGVGGVWTRNDIAIPLALIQKKDFPPGDDTAPTDCAVFHINGSELADGYNTVACTVDGSATCAAYLYDLTVQRAPQNLPALV